MSIVALTVVLAAAMAGVAVVLNHCYARVALVELALNEGLPPGHRATTVTTSAAIDPAEVLAAGVHVFLSRNCHACQRLIDELSLQDLVIDASIHLHYVDRPRPIASTTAETLGASLYVHQSELAGQVGADPLPYTIAIGDHDLVGRSVTPTVAQIAVTARDAGISVT